MDKEYFENYYDLSKRYDFSLVHPLNIDLVTKFIGWDIRFRTPTSLVVENMGLYQFLFDMGRKYENDYNKSWEGGEEMGR